MQFIKSVESYLGTRSHRITPWPISAPDQRARSCWLDLLIG
jgi:hypothetical protein